MPWPAFVNNPSAASFLATLFATRIAARTLLCGLVDDKTLTTYGENILGIDCGGFVANYWGIGRPSETTRSPTGATGYKPRTIWGMFPSQQWRSAGEIQADDAAVFFQDVKFDDANISRRSKMPVEVTTPAAGRRRSTSASLPRRRRSPEPTLWIWTLPDLVAPALPVEIPE